MDHFVYPQVASIVKKSSDEKNNDQADIHGRIEYIDQGLRSVDNRMRAIEKRLSIKTFEHDPAISPGIGIAVENTGLKDIHEKMLEIDRKFGDLEKTTQDTHASDTASYKSQLLLFENRISKLENQNKISIGKIRVPIEFSGLAAAIVMFATGYLIYSDHWNVIRSSYYPVAIGILFGAVVLGKFIMTKQGIII